MMLLHALTECLAGASLPCQTGFKHRSLIYLGMRGAVGWRFPAFCSLSAVGGHERSGRQQSVSSAGMQCALMPCCKADGNTMCWHVVCAVAMLQGRWEDHMLLGNCADSSWKLWASHLE